MSAPRPFAGKLPKSQRYNPNLIGPESTLDPQNQKKRIFDLLKIYQPPKDPLQKCANTVFPFYNHQKCVAVLKKIDPNSDEFKNKAKRVEYYGGDRTGFKVVDIFNLTNPARELAFENTLKIDSLRLACSKHHSTSEIMFHCTRIGNLNTILKDGLKTEYSQRGRYGRGIYLSEDPRKAALYCKKDPRQFNKKIMLLVNVAPGRTVIYNNTINPYLERVPPEKDSVKGIIGGLSEHVLYDNNRVNVVGVIVFQCVKLYY